MAVKLSAKNCRFRLLPGGSARARKRTQFALLFALALLMWPGSVRHVSGQEPVKESGTAQTPAEGTDQAQVFGTDREYDRHFINLQAAVTRRDWAVVGRQLLELQSVPPDLLVRANGTTSSIPVAAARLLATLPEEGRAVYLRLAEPVAREKLKSAMQRSDIQTILEVARKYRHTAAALEATQILIRHHVDLGEWEEAVLVSERSRQVTPGSPSPRFLIEQTKIKERTQQAELVPEYLERQFPSQIPAWEYVPDRPPQVVESIEKAYRELRQSGITPFPTQSILRIPQKIVLCGPAERVALHMASGQPDWRRLIPGYASRWIQSPGDLSDQNRRRMFTISVMRQTFDESVTTSTSSNGDQLFFIESIGIDDPVAKPISEFMTALPASRVVCASAERGETEWEYNGEPAGETTFAGPPAIFGDQLYVLGETRSQGTMRLFILNAASGKPIRVIELAAPWITVADDDAHHGDAARIEIAGGQLICATASGAIISVDPLLGEINWAIRLPRPPVATPSTKQLEVQAKSAGYEKWNGWQQVYLLMSGDYLVYATPESDLFSVIHQETGKLIGQYRREQAVHMALCEPLSLIVLMGKTTAVGMNFKTGDVNWTTFIPQPAGNGIVAGSTYLFPIQEQTMARLNLQSGELELAQSNSRGPLNNDELLPFRIRPRHLVASGGSVYELGIGTLSRLQSPQEAELVTNFRSEWESILSRIERGETAVAVGELRKLIKNSEQKNLPEIRSTLSSLLTETFRRETSQSARQLLQDEISHLAATPAERAHLRQQRALRALQNREWNVFMQHWLHCPEDELHAYLPALHEDSRCRLDRWFQAEAVRYRAEATVAQQTQLDHIVMEQLRQAQAEDQPRLAETLGQTPWGVKLNVDLPEKSGGQQDLIRWQLRLTQMFQHEDPGVAARAGRQLLQMYAGQEAWRDASRWLDRLRQLPAETEIEDGRTVHQLIEEWEPLVAQAVEQDAACQPWPAVKPRVTTRPSNEKSVYFYAIPVEDRQQGLFSRLNVELDMPTRGYMRFNGGSWNRPWTCSLPKSDRNLRFYAELDRAWGFEQFCLIQTSNEISGIAPFNTLGSTAARRIWPQKKANSIDTIGSRENASLNFRWLPGKERPGIALPPGQWMDEFGHFLSSIGPVRAGYFCIQQMGMLVAYETATGQELWRRYDLPQQARTAGDDDQIALISPLEKKLTLLSARDGRMISQRTWSHNPDDIIHQADMRLTLIQGDHLSETNSSDEESADSAPEPQPDATPPEPVLLQQLDSATGDTVWQKTYPPGTIPFEIDQNWLGMLAPDGMMEFVDVKTGIAARQHQLQIPKSVQRVVCIPGSNDFIVVVSGPNSSSGFSDDGELQLGYRRLILNGTAWSFQRESGDLVWTTQLPEGVVRLDQPVDLPIFVVISRAPALKVQREVGFEEEEEKDPVEPNEFSPFNTAGVVLRCFDRRDGKLLHELTRERVNYSITGNRARQSVVISTMKTRLEFDFSNSMEKGSAIPEDVSPDTMEESGN